MRIKRVFGTIIETAPKSVAFVEFFRVGNGEKWIALGTTDEEVLKEHGIENPFNKSITNVAEHFAENSFKKLNEYLTANGENPITPDRFITVEYWPNDTDPDGRPHPEYYRISFDEGFKNPKWEEIPSAGIRRKEKVLLKLFEKGKRPKP